MAPVSRWLTLDLDPALQQRLTAITARKGASMHRYNQVAIGRELTRDEAHGVSGKPFNRQSFERIVARPAELFGGKPLSEDAADLIRESREIRDVEIEEWA